MILNEEILMGSFFKAIKHNAEQAKNRDASPL